MDLETDKEGQLSCVPGSGATTDNRSPQLALFHRGFILQSNHVPLMTNNQRAENDSALICGAPHQLRPKQRFSLVTKRSFLLIMIYTSSCKLQAESTKGTICHFLMKPCLCQGAGRRESFLTGAVHTCLTSIFAKTRPLRRILAQSLLCRGDTILLSRWKAFFWHSCLWEPPIRWPSNGSKQLLKWHCIF